MITDCKNETIPLFAIGKVVSCKTVPGSLPENSVFELIISVEGKENFLPNPGQFYMLQAVKGKSLLGRPISVYHTEIISKTSDKVFANIHFLILKKGLGTAELCNLTTNENVNILGPLGNVFPHPQNGKKVCIIGGGIGVAPVAGFAETLSKESYDFYASFKSGSYGLNYVKANNLIITTDDGSVGIKGMLPSALNSKSLLNGKYNAVYACGPLPMLSYVKKIADGAGIPCWLSMESRMACGMGACLGCTINTTEGFKRCCKEGPVFNANILDFSVLENTSPTPRGAVAPKKIEACDVDLSVNLCGIKLKNPIIGASGTFGYGVEYSPLFDVNRLGGIASKGLTLEARQGNTGIRVWETPSGLMNSIGLQNPGIPHFIQNELPKMLSFDTVTLANLSGSSLETYVEGAKLLDKTAVPLIELNISCPNVKAGGAAFGMTSKAASEVVKEVRKVTSKPLIVKLTPQAPDIISVALSCIESGANALSLCNSFQGVAIDIEKGRPVFDNVRAGVGGPAIRPIALRYVFDMVQAINKLPEFRRVPIVGIGGIATWQDAVEFIMAGATALEVGTSTFSNPFSMINIIEGLSNFMAKKGFQNLQEMRGIAQ